MNDELDDEWRDPGPANGIEPPYAFLADVSVPVSAAEAEREHSGVAG
jgi:hypothetical protein